VYSGTEFWNIAALSLVNNVFLLLVIYKGKVLHNLMLKELLLNIMDAKRYVVFEVNMRFGCQYRKKFIFLLLLVTLGFGI